MQLEYCFNYGDFDVRLDRDEVYKNKKGQLVSKYTYTVYDENGNSILDSSGETWSDIDLAYNIACKAIDEYLEEKQQEIQAIIEKVSEQLRDVFGLTDKIKNTSEEQYGQ